MSPRLRSRTETPSKLLSISSSASLAQKSDGLMAHLEPRPPLYSSHASTMHIERRVLFTLNNHSLTSNFFSRPKLSWKHLFLETSIMTIHLGACLIINSRNFRNFNFHCHFSTLVAILSPSFPVNCMPWKRRTDC